ncbi:hypothetical protein CEQ30_40585 [Nocardia brasiliensis]|nr:hypothetical protein CEQ30_40585 [Nocardia brasiliensis]
MAAGLGVVRDRLVQDRAEERSARCLEVVPRLLPILCRVDLARGGRPGRGRRGLGGRCGRWGRGRTRCGRTGRRGLRGGRAGRRARTLVVVATPGQQRQRDSAGHHCDTSSSDLHDGIVACAAAHAAGTRRHPARAITPGRRPRSAAPDQFLRACNV